MNRTTVSLLLILLVVAAACSNVESYAGVDLATAAVEPSATPPPTATPDPQAVDLPNLGEKEFSGTVVTFNYPENWISNESGQSFNVFDPGEQYGDLDRPAVGTFIQLTRTQGLDGNENNLATQVMMRFLGMASQRGFANADSVPDADSPVNFTWGDNEAALYTWRNPEENTIGTQVVVLDNDRRRFVLMATGIDIPSFEDFEPIWKGMMGTVTLDGEALPAADFLTAYETMAARLQ
jgi:hypothetical protein